MSAFVLDASVAVAWLLNEEGVSTAEPALSRLESDEALVPQLWHLEVRNSLLVATRRGRLPPDAPTERLDALRDLPVRTDSGLDLSLAFALAQKHGLSIYDAVYLELAMRHRAPIATLDKALARAADMEGLSVLVRIEAR